MHLRPDSCHRLNLKESEITLEAAKSPASASHFMKCQINNDKWNFCECKSCRYKCETADVETGEKVIIYHQLNFLPIMILLAVTNNRVLCVCVYLWNKFVFISGWEADQFAPSEKELTKSTNLRQWCGSWSVDFKSDSSKYISINCSVSCYPLTSSNGRVKEKKLCQDYGRGNSCLSLEILLTAAPLESGPKLTNNIYVRFVKWKKRTRIEWNDKSNRTKWKKRTENACTDNEITEKGRRLSIPNQMLFG